MKHKKHPGPFERWVIKTRPKTVAKLLGVTLPTLYHWFSGKDHVPSVKHMHKMVDLALGEFDYNDIILECAPPKIEAKKKH